jgi:hypothetical protein
LPNFRVVHQEDTAKKNGARRRMWGEDGNGMRLIELSGQ